MVVALPKDVAEQFDEDLLTFVDDPHLDDDEPGLAEGRPNREPRPVYYGATIPRDEPTDDGDDDAPRVKVMVPLSPAEPYLFSQDVLRELWSGAMDAHDHPGRAGPTHRTIPVGPYRLAVIPSGRGRSAVVAALQGLHQGKQIEIPTPSALVGNTAAETVIAIWGYQDSSLLVAHLDFQSKERYILWHAPNVHQFNFEYLAELKHILATAFLEIPVELDRVLSRR
jgi:hypothetical protein